MDDKLKRITLITLVLIILTCMFFFFPAVTLERRECERLPFKEDLDNIKTTMIEEYDLEPLGIFRCEVIYFDTASPSYIIIGRGIHYRYYLFLVDYKADEQSKWRYFIFTIRVEEGRGC